MRRDGGDDATLDSRPPHARDHGAPAPVPEIDWRAVERSATNMRGESAGNLPAAPSAPGVRGIPPRGVWGSQPPAGNASQRANAAGSEGRGREGRRPTPAPARAGGERLMPNYHGASFLAARSYAGSGAALAPGGLETAFWRDLSSIFGGDFSPNPPAGGRA